jgi:hypothetical protein
MKGGGGHAHAMPAPHGGNAHDGGQDMERMAYAAGAGTHEAPPQAPVVKAVAKANANARTSSTTLSQMTGARFAELNIHANTKRAIAEVLTHADACWRMLTYADER